MELAIKLEEQLAVIHMSTVVVFEDPASKKLFAAMMEADRGHVSALREYLQKLPAV